MIAILDKGELIYNAMSQELSQELSPESSREPSQTTANVVDIVEDKESYVDVDTIRETKDETCLTNLDVEIIQQDRLPSVREVLCKYCHQPEGGMIKPCKCNDYVHYSCLEKWQKSRSGNKDICEICHTKYSGATIFDRKKCISEYFIYICIILLTFFVMIGCTGYDIVGKALNDSYTNTPFEDFIMVSTLLGICAEVVFIIMAFLWTFMEESVRITKKNIVRFLLVNIGLQIIPVLVCSIVLKRFFWNISTLSMGIIGVACIAVVIAILGIIGLIVFGIGILIKNQISSNYSTTLYTDREPDREPDQASEQASDQASDQNV